MRRLAIIISTVISSLALAVPAYARTAPPAPAQAAVFFARPHPATLARTARRATHTVRRGDTLSSVARRFLGHSWRWEGLYAANMNVIGSSPGVISPGERLTLASPAPRGLAARRIYRYLHPPAPRPAYHAPAAPGPAPAAAPVAPAAPVTYSGSGSMQQCIIARESGGNSQVMNSTGHYGLYQYSYSTWVANGGNPGDFGSASVSEQNQVFASTVASSGYSAWTAYDGC